jgi:ADP-ribosylglycohydrolase
MSDSTTFSPACEGSLVADAFAMPVHWYYDRDALQRDYGPLEAFTAPRNPHPDSILWRSDYQPENERGEILHDQARYWGQRGIHYHQFLKAGENTLNFQLARELVRWCRAQGGYDPDAWMERYVEVMRTPGWHRDTYVEEVHRGFFTQLARGKALRKCSVRDEHIGGLSQVPALCSISETLDLPELRSRVKEHVGLTHAHPNVLRAADTLVRVLWSLQEGDSLEEALQGQAGDWLSLSKADRWLSQPDTHVIGNRFSPACYIDQAMPASLYLAWKYRDDFSAAIRANAEVGGDNCHRGAVVGAVVGMLHPDEVRRWRELQPQS